MILSLEVGSHCRARSEGTSEGTEVGGHLGGSSGTHRVRPRSTSGEDVWRVCRGRLAAHRLADAIADPMVYVEGEEGLPDLLAQNFPLIAHLLRNLLVLPTEDRKPDEEDAPRPEARNN